MRAREKRTKGRAAPVVAVACCFLGASSLVGSAAWAQNVKLVGNVGYETLSGQTQVVLTADRVENRSTTRTTGTLYLRLWATRSSSAASSGYVLASARLGELEPSEYFYSIRQTTTFSAPPDGTYYIHMVVSEYPNLLTFLDTRTFSRRLTFGDGGGGGSGANVKLVGNVGYETLSGQTQVVLTADRVENRSTTRTTGTLYLRLWATRSSSAASSGYVLASARLGELEPSEYFYDIRQTTTFSAPPDGTYYIHMVVSEYPNLLTFLDTRTFSRRLTFGGCTLSPGHVDYCSTPGCGPCTYGEGDCDGDGECAGSLICGTDNGSEFGLPANYDVCVDRAVSCRLSPGHPAYCSTPGCGPCAHGEGDCDSDAECAGSLICGMDNGREFGLPANYDVCVDDSPTECTLYPGHPAYCSTPGCGPCSYGQGDCDSSAECDGSLVCVADNGADFGLPANYDVCADSSRSRCPLSPGHPAYCSTPGCRPCSYGQGDCDGSAECAGSLECVADNGADFGLPANYDVCVQGPCVSSIRLTTSVTRLTRLWASNCTSRNRSRRYAKYYTFSLSSTTLVQIDLRSHEDAYLFLLQGAGTAGSVIESDDDDGDGEDARITRTLGRGTYTIEATTYASRKTGSFTLFVRTAR